MYLSRIGLEGARGDTMRLLASPHMLHGAVEQCFTGERRRNLWRIDYLANEPFLLVLSEEAPDFERLARRYGRENMSPSWEIKSYDTLLSRVQEGQVWRFRLRANPVRSSARERDQNKNRGKVFSHVTQDQQKTWLAMRGEANGFRVENESFDVVHAQWQKFRKGADRQAEVSILAVTFEGMLTVSDPNQFCATLTGGIGREKAYGCGLLTIARLGR